MKREPFFSVSENRSRLSEIANSWVGTPFHANGCVKGPNGGTSCVGLVYGVAAELGLVSEDNEIELPEGPVAVEWHKHSETSLLNEFFRSPKIRKHLKLVDTEHDTLEIGDLLAFKIDGIEHHLGWLIDELHVIHCNRRKGVVIASFLDLKPIFSSAYRIYA